MATIRVTPLPDGENQRYGWQVKKNGARKSTHYKKSGAKRKARNMAGSGDTLYIHRQDGTVQKVI